MSATPEQRAAKAVPTLLQVGREGQDHEVRPWLRERVARAIRAAENAALEEAAKVAEGCRATKMDFNGKVTVEAPHLPGYIAKQIRSLKRPAARSEAKGRKAR